MLIPYRRGGPPFAKLSRRDVKLYPHGRGALIISSSNPSGLLAHPKEAVATAVARPGRGASQPSEKPPPGVHFSAPPHHTTHTPPTPRPEAARGVQLRCAVPLRRPRVRCRRPHRHPPTTALLPRLTVLLDRPPNRDSNRRPRDRRTRRPAPAPCRAHNVCRNWPTGVPTRTHTRALPQVWVCDVRCSGVYTSRRILAYANGPVFGCPNNYLLQNLHFILLLLVLLEMQARDFGFMPWLCACEVL